MIRETINSFLMNKHDQLYREGEDPFVEQGTSDSVLSSIGDLILTRNPSDLDDPDLLRALWFLIAVYYIILRNKIYIYYMMMDVIRNIAGLE